MIKSYSLISHHAQQHSTLSTNCTYLKAYFYLVYFVDLLNFIHLLLENSFFISHY